MCWELYIQHCIYQHLYNMYSVSGISSNPEMTSSLWENVCRLFYRGTWVSLDLGTLRGPGTHPPWTQGNECKAMNEEQLGILTKNRPASAMASNMWLTPTQECKTHATLQGGLTSWASGETQLVPWKLQHCPDVSSPRLICRFQVTLVEISARLVQPQFTSRFHPAFTSIKVKPKPQTPNQASLIMDMRPSQSYLWSDFLLSCVMN